MGRDSWEWGRKGVRQQGRQSGVYKEWSLGSSLLPEVRGSVLYVLQRLSCFFPLMYSQRGEEPSLGCAAITARAELGCSSMAVSCPETAVNILVSQCLSLIPPISHPAPLCVLSATSGNCLTCSTC